MLDHSPIIVADNQAITNAGIKAMAQQVLHLPQSETADTKPQFVDARTKKELISLLSLHPEALTVVDYTNLDFRDIDDLLILHKRFEGVRWLLLSATLSEAFLRRAAAEENISILLKDCEADEIRSGLTAAARGDQYICRAVKGMLSTAVERNDMASVLTPTETEILKLIAQGNSVKEIAAKRVSSVHTITTHKKNIFLKIGVNNVYEATKYALRAGLLELMEYYI